jgi:hypothetical protein
VQRVRESANRASCLNNLKQIGIALQLYHDNYRAFPPSQTTQPLNPGWGNRHNWATFILPHLEQQTVFAKYVWEVDWDDPRNQGVVTMPLKVYQCPSTPNPTRKDRLPGSGLTAAVTDYGALDGIAEQLGESGYIPQPANHAGPPQERTHAFTARPSPSKSTNR